MRISSGDLTINLDYLLGSGKLKEGDDKGLDRRITREIGGDTQFQKLIAHEIGHCLGIGNGWTGARVMTGSFGAEESDLNNYRNFLIDRNAKDYKRPPYAGDELKSVGNEYRGPATPYEVNINPSEFNGGFPAKAFKKSDPYYKAHSYLVDTIKIDKDFKLNNLSDKGPDIWPPVAPYKAKESEEKVGDVPKYIEWKFYKKGSLFDSDITIGDLVRHHTAPWDADASIAVDDHGC